jgi:hypothetical protein
MHHPHRSFVLIAVICLGCALGVTGCKSRRGPETDAAAPLEHVVAAGDTLSSLATAYGVTITAIIKANDLTDRTLQPGQRLIIPSAQRQPPTTPVDETAPAGPSSDWYLPRSAWAAEPIVMRLIDPMGGTPRRITVHHSNSGIDNDPDAEEVLRKFDRNAIKGINQPEKWACIGYHFIIARDGRVFEGRPIAYQGAHAGNSEVNRFNIGVCLIGDFEHHAVPRLQRDTLAVVLDRLRADYGIPRQQVFGHKHFKPSTECPGRYLQSVVDIYRQGE